MPDIADKFRRKNLLDELYKQTGAERYPSFAYDPDEVDRLHQRQIELDNIIKSDTTPESDIDSATGALRGGFFSGKTSPKGMARKELAKINDKLKSLARSKPIADPGKRDRDVLVGELRGKVRGGINPLEWSHSPTTASAKERTRMEMLGDVPTKRLGEIVGAGKVAEVKRGEERDASQVGVSEVAELEKSLGVDSLSGARPSQPPATEGALAPEDAAVTEANARGAELLRQQGMEPEPVLEAKAKEDQDEFAYWKSQIEQYGDEYQGQINALRQQLEDEKPDLWSPGSILYMLSFGPQKWIQRHDQMNERYKDRRDAIVRAGLEGKLREGGQASQMAQTKAYLGARKDRPAPVRRGGSPALIYKDIMARYGQNISGLKSPDDVFQYTVDKLDETTGKVVKVPKTGNIYSASLEWGKRYGLSPEESEQVAQTIIQSKFGGIK